MTDPRPSGAILAGGASRRMRRGAGTEVGPASPALPAAGKALLELAGRPLLQHVIDRLRPQVGALMLSVESHLAEFERWDIPQVADPRAGRQGPLGGLLAALGALPGGNDWLLLVPCDAPFLPLDLGFRLGASAHRHGQPGAIAAWHGVWQPTFSLWHRDLLPELAGAVLKEGMGGFKQFLARRALPVVDWPETEVNPFFNVNTPADLDRARAMVDPSSACM